MESQPPFVGSARSLLSLHLQHCQVCLLDEFAPHGKDGACTVEHPPVLVLFWTENHLRPHRMLDVVGEKRLTPSGRLSLSFAQPDPYRIRVNVSLAKVSRVWTQFRSRGSLGQGITYLFQILMSHWRWALLSPFASTSSSTGAFRYLWTFARLRCPCPEGAHSAGRALGSRPDEMSRWLRPTILDGWLGRGKERELTVSREPGAPYKGHNTRTPSTLPSPYAAVPSGSLSSTLPDPLDVGEGAHFQDLDHFASGYLGRRRAGGTPVHSRRRPKRPSPTPLLPALPRPSVGAERPRRARWG